MTVSENFPTYFFISLLSVVIDDSTFVMHVTFISSNEVILCIVNL